MLRKLGAIVKRSTTKNAAVKQKLKHLKRTTQKFNFKKYNKNKTVLTLAGVNKLLKVRSQTLSILILSRVGRSSVGEGYIMDDHINSDKMKWIYGRTIFGEWRHTKYSKR